MDRDKVEVDILNEKQQQKKALQVSSKRQTSHISPDYLYLG